MGRAIDCKSKYRITALISIMAATFPWESPGPGRNPRDLGRGARPPRLIRRLGRGEPTLPRAEGKRGAVNIHRESIDGWQITTYGHGVLQHPPAVPRMARGLLT